MPLLRQVLGQTLRGRRERQRRTLREVSGAARVSLGYLSEVERGQKEASSELLASICDALGVPLSDVLEEASIGLKIDERQRAGALALRVPVGAGGPVGQPMPSETSSNGAAPAAPAIETPAAQPEPASASAAVTMSATPMTVPGAKSGEIAVSEETAREIEETFLAIAADIKRPVGAAA